MPTYEYRCNACSYEFEEMHKMSDPPIKVCPKCSEHQVERLISLTSFQLKGGGWYSDLYSSSKGGKKEAAASETKSDSKSESKTESKSESKSESKAETKSDTSTKTETKSSDTKTAAKP